MLQKLLFLLPLAVAVLAQDTTNNGIEYDGTSNVRRSPTYHPDYQPQRMTPAPPVTNSVATVATRPDVNSFPPRYSPGYRPTLQPHPITLVSQLPHSQSTLPPAMTVSHPYSPDHLNIPLPTTSRPDSQQNVVFENNKETGITELRDPAVSDQPALVSPQPSQTAQPDVVIQPVVTSQPEIAPQSQPEPSRQPEVILTPEPVQVITPPAPSRQPEVVPTPEPFHQPEVISQPPPNFQPVIIRQPQDIPQPQPPRQPVVIITPKPVQVIPLPAPTSQPEVASTPEPFRQPEIIPQPQPNLQPVITRQPQDTPQPQPSLPTVFSPQQQQPTIQPGPTTQPQWYTPAPAPVSQPKYTKAPVSQGTALLPLLPKQKPIREPVFGRPTHPTPTVVYPTPSYTRPYPTTYLPTYTTPSPVVTRVPPTVVTRIPTQVVSRTPPTIVIVTPRPTGPFKTEFQCPESNGFYSIANSCDAYFECKGYVAERRICPNGLYFNPTAKYSDYSPCAYPSEVQCTAGNVIQRPQPNPTSKCPAPFGSFAINDGDCSRFIMCQEGLATIMNCPMGLVFNNQTQTCDWPINVPQCTPTVFKDFTCPPPPVEKNGEISDIIYKYRYGVQCKSFVACQNGRPRFLSCDSGLAFDEQSQTCISEEFVTNCATPYSAAVV